MLAVTAVCCKLELLGSDCFVVHDLNLWAVKTLRYMCGTFGQ